MNDEVIWLTYDALAERLGIERESARQRARRGMWARRKDNAGRLTVAVPVELLGTPPEPLPVARSDALRAEGDADHVALHGTDTNRYLNRYIETVEQALEETKGRLAAVEQERDVAKAAEQALAVQIAGLQAVVDAERKLHAGALDRVAEEKARVDEWKAVADRFALQAEALAVRPGRFFGLFRRRA
jgi:hypothetical protein